MSRWLSRTVAIRRGVRHERRGHHESLGANALRETVDDFVRVGRGSAGQTAHKRDELDDAAPPARA